MSIADELQFVLDWEADRMGAVSAGTFKAQIAAVRDLEFQQAVLARGNHGEAAARDQLQRANLAALADERGDEALCRAHAAEAVLQDLRDCGAVANWLRVSDDLKVRVEAILGPNDSLNGGA